MGFRETYNRFAESTEGVGAAVGSSMNAMLAGCIALGALKERDFGTALESGAIALALGSAGMDLALRHDTGSGIPERVAHVVASHVQPHVIQ
jgi:phosphotransferase system  glucose/maltose/N-acetylglucosamine-specific IIC component